MNRRVFIKTGLMAAVTPGMSFAALPHKSITIAKTSCGFEREPMMRPFGFKGGYLTEEWIVSAYVASTSGKHGIGDLGLVETNGHMNFRNWETMRKDLAYPDAHWTRTEKGVFECDADYYAKSGGILEPMPRYEKMYEMM
jgi:hypothetical protein